MLKLLYLRQYGKGDEYVVENSITGKLMFTEKHVGGWQWAIEDDLGIVFEYHTDKDGNGLWRNGKQLLGTCQYSAPITRSGMRKRIMKRYM